VQRFILGIENECSVTCTPRILRRLTDAEVTAILAG